MITPTHHLPTLISACVHRCAKYLSIKVLVLLGCLLVTLTGWGAGPRRTAAETSEVILRDLSAITLSTGAVRVKWSTSAESNSASFTLYRAAGLSNERKIANSAQKITPADIDAGTDGHGGAYEYIDESAIQGQAYTYWLVETERDGRINIYGPAQRPATTEYQVFLPFLRR